ncbi:MAG TPA: hypothetical protein VG056_17680 [Pirellulales bacterium]|jgi:hypothetical protein|nr:hypothetical protein [Pirellulales bacterium]
MSVGPMGFFGSIAATPLSQSQGSDADRVAQESSAQTGQAANATKAKNAAGIGATDGEEHAAAERDADGRRIWEKSPGKKKPAAAGAETLPAEPPPLSKDATGASGNQLDLTG